MKLEAIRPLAGGLSHEFNNILNVILAFGDGLMTDLEAEEQRAAPLREMLKAARRGTELTHQLLAFSQQLFLQPRRLDLNEVLRSLEPVAREIAGTAIQLELRPSVEPCPCKLDRRQLERALVALLGCARDDMSSGGKLTIETANVWLEASDLLESANGAPGPHVLLSVADTGSGLDTGAMARLFEPFYSSKQLGRGFGLGLAAVYGLVSQCGGLISVDSTRGAGTVFNLYFPSAPAVGASTAG